MNKKWIVSQENISKFGNNFPHPTIMKPAAVDELVTDFTERINIAATNAFRKTSGEPREGKSTPWWDEECATAISERRRA